MFFLNLKDFFTNKNFLEGGKREKIVEWVL